jgi:hypothetical protein
MNIVTATDDDSIDVYDETARAARIRDSAESELDFMLANWHAPGSLLN